MSFNARECVFMSKSASPYVGPKGARDFLNGRGLLGGEGLLNKSPLLFVPNGRERSELPEPCFPPYLASPTMCYAPIFPVCLIRGPND